MRIKWFGQSCFLLTSMAGVGVLMDPFKADSYLSYAQVKQPADIVTVSHEHFDHNYLADIPGQYEVLKGGVDRIISGISIKGIKAFHDDSLGKERGVNTVFCVNMDGINICHLGDLGHRLSSSEIAAVGKVDILLVPVGGVFTIDCEVAARVCQDINPQVVIPMHYKTDRCQFLQWTADDFIKGKPNARKLDSSEVEFSSGSLPSGMEIIILKYPA